VKSTPPENAWLADIATACERVGRFLQGVDYARFIQDDEKRFAVYSQIIIIGEAANRFSPEFQQACAALPWRQMVGMRNRMVHAYDAIDWSIVWETASVQIPALLAALQPLLPAKQN
jgi:uncharacterized protein with HEPN domain